MPKWLRTLVIPLAVLALIAAACGDDAPTNPGDGSAAPECNADLSVGVAYDIGGIGDKSFNDAANAGLTAALDEGLVCEENTDSLEPDATGSNRDDNVIALADAGHNLVIAVGFAFSPGINENAGDYPDTQFAIIDGYATCGTCRASVPGTLELAGNPNVLTRDHGTSSLAQGPSAHTCLVQVERSDVDAPRPRIYTPPPIVREK